MKITNQEMYDIAKDGIIAQGDFGFDARKGPHGSCEYLTESGLKCAIGMIINQHGDYKEEFDQGMEAFEVLEDLGFELDEFQNEFACELQYVHDNAAVERQKDKGKDGFIDWAARMTELARCWKLKP